jgi:dipeptidyl aminopeptidase/acylaminoacyl peptidase
MKMSTDWSADGRFLTYTDTTPSQDSDLWVLPMGGDQKPVVFLQTQFREAAARVSPDSHWIAYHSNESGRDEVYVQTFPAPGGTVKISTGGGTFPKWRADGKEIFYTNSNSLMAAEVIRAQSGKPFEAGPPRLLFQATFLNSNNAPYDVSRDGQRFIISGFAQVTPLPSIPITVVLNWPALFQKK